MFETVTDLSGFRRAFGVAGKNETSPSLGCEFAPSIMPSQINVPFSGYLLIILAGYLLMLAQHGLGYAFDAYI